MKKQILNGKKDQRGLDVSKWKDATSYSRGGDRKPHWWQIELGSVRLCVGDTQLGFEPGEHWFVTCHGLFDLRVLKATNKQAAQAEALLMVKRNLDPIWSDLAVALGEAMSTDVRTDKA